MLAKKKASVEYRRNADSWRKKRLNDQAGNKRNRLTVDYLCNDVPQPGWNEDETRMERGWNEDGTRMEGWDRFYEVNAYTSTIEYSSGISRFCATNIDESTNSSVESRFS